jgi:hypothetical protein
MDILPRRRTEKEIPALIANNQDTAIENVTNFIPIKAALYLNNTQDATQEIGQSQTSAEKEKALSNSLQMKVDLSAIKTPFKNLTAQQLTNNLSGKNNYNGG